MAFSFYVLRQRFCLYISVVHFCGEPALMGVCPSWHSAIWQMNVAVVTPVSFLLRLQL